jgi:gluconate 2-dehydrogenase gamma chain
MATEDSLKLARRAFLTGVAAVTGAAPLMPGVMTGVAAAATVAAVEGPAQASGGAAPIAERSSHELGYESLGPDEIEFIEAVVTVMCPADNLTPNGVDCGLATFIDRQLAGGFGKGERLYMRGPWRQGKPQHGYQLPLSPEQFFKVGVAAANEAAAKKFGKSFSELMSADADAFLHDLAAGNVKDARLSLSSWFNELVYPLFIQACFADPIYGGNGGKVFWKMIGYPGLPATHARDMVEFRGKPYPGADDPKAIPDFS